MNSKQEQTMRNNTFTQNTSYGKNEKNIILQENSRTEVASRN